MTPFDTDNKPRSNQPSLFRRIAPWRWGLVLAMTFGLLAFGFYASPPRKIPQITGITYEAMLKKLEQVQTIQYRVYESYPGEPNAIVYNRRLYIGGKLLKREEMESGVERSLLGQVKYSVRARINGWNDAGRCILIHDYASGKHIMIHPNEMRMDDYTHTITKDATGKVLSKTDVPPGLDVNLLKNFRGMFILPAEDVRPLGTELIDGQAAVGFTATGDWENWHRRETFWVDPQTRLPVLIEVDLVPMTTGYGTQRWLLTEIVFDEPMDDALFDTSAPKGYTVRERAYETVQTPAVGEGQN